MMVWLLLLSLGGGMVIDQVVYFSKAALGDLSQLTHYQLISVAYEALKTVLWALIPPVLVAALSGLLVERAQVGAVFAVDKLVPKPEVLNPAEGMKKLVSVDKLVDAGKAVVKAIVVIWAVFLVLYDSLPEYLVLDGLNSASVVPLLWHSILRISGMVLFVFLFISLFDVLYQKYSYTKNLRMSLRDIKQEQKEQNGDPALKSQRKQLHQQWMQQGALDNVRKANVVVTNPIHFAVALRYEPGETDLPIVVAKGQELLAREIRTLAEEAGVPVMENISLARGLFADIELDHYITSEYFELVAEVLRWAHEVAHGMMGDVLTSKE